jgi:hypothetical protein
MNELKRVFLLCKQFFFFLTHLASSPANSMHTVLRCTVDSTYGTVGVEVRARTSKREGSLALSYKQY